MTFDYMLKLFHVSVQALCASYVDHKHSQRKANFQADTDWQ